VLLQQLVASLQRMPRQQRRMTDQETGQSLRQTVLRIALQLTANGLNHPPGALATHPDHPARNLTVIAEPRMFWAESVLDRRMKRDGWTQQSTTKRVFRGRTIAGEYPQELEKPDPKSRRLLVVRDLSDGILHNRAFRFAVIYRRTGEEMLSFEATWADWDQQGQLAYSSGGKVWRVDFPPRGRAPETREIADFNRLRPDPQPSPEWAKEW